MLRTGANQKLDGVFHVDQPKVPWFRRSRCARFSVSTEVAAGAEPPVYFQYVIWLQYPLQIAAQHVGVCDPWRVGISEPRALQVHEEGVCAQLRLTFGRDTSECTSDTRSNCSPFATRGWHGASEYRSTMTFSQLQLAASHGGSAG